MGKVFLIIGAVLGGLILGFGALGLIGTLTDNTLSSSDRSDGIYGSMFIMAVGLALFAPCLFFLVRSQSGNTLALMNQGMAYGGAVAGLTPTYAPVDMTSYYLQWFGWCRREISGNAIALHAATMAAMAAAGEGNSGDSANAARQAAARTSTLAEAQAQATKTPTGKIRILARIGAATLPLLEPGERVGVSFHGTDRQAQLWQTAFGVIGMLIAMSQRGSYYVTVTDRRLIALTGPQLSQMPNALSFAVPHSMVTEARFRGGLLGGGTFIIRRVDGGLTRIRLTRFFKSEGQAAQAMLAQGLGLTPLPPLPAMTSKLNF